MNYFRDYCPGRGLLRWYLPLAARSGLTKPLGLWLIQARGGFLGKMRSVLNVQSSGSCFVPGLEQVVEFLRLSESERFRLSEGERFRLSEIFRTFE